MSPPERNPPQDDPAARVVHGRVADLVGELALAEARIRGGRSGGVHRMRVASRRLRSVLASFGALYDETRVTALRDELRWVAGELGGARDTEVVRRRVTDLATTDEERALAGRVLEELEQVATDSSTGPVEVLDSARYAHLLGELISLVDDPPMAASPAGPDLLRRRVRRDWKRLQRLAEEADSLSGDERIDGLHEVRKKSKRLRYTSETLVPPYGDDARRLARRAKRLQTVLGEVQDSAVVQQTLRELAERPGWTPRESVLLAVLVERDQERAAEVEASYAGARSRLSLKKNRGWLR